MNQSGIIEELMEGIYVAWGHNQYNEDVGLLSENKWLEEICII